MISASARLVSLWLSQLGRIMAEQALRAYVVLKAAQVSANLRDSAWHLAVALFVLPAVVLAPLNGALANSLPKRRVLIGAAAWGLAVTAIFGPPGGAWLWWCIGLGAIGSALYNPTRYALLPAAAQDTGIPLSRVNAVIEMGAAVAIVGGLLLGAQLTERPETYLGLDAPLAAILALNFLGLVAVWPVCFPSDVRRSESLQQALAGFFRDAGRIWRNRPARASLLGSAGFRGLVAAATGAFVASHLHENASHAAAGVLLTEGLWVLAGVAAGSLLAGLQGHPWRSAGLIPFGLTGLAIALAWMAAASVSAGLCVFLGLMAGLVNVPLNTIYQANVPADARGNGMAVLSLGCYAVMTIVAFLMTALAGAQVVSPAGQFALLAALSGLVAAATWYGLCRQVLELLTEILVSPLYRVRVHGSGVLRVPASGPVLVLANHTAWMDPVWVAKVVPRRLTPMMTSVFYDIPGLRWLMTHVVKAIRVESSFYRRNVPELQLAIDILDQGEAVLIFPEGWMRRVPEARVRMFGQGVWHILTRRPQTPVVVCWIEGGYGTFFSYAKGPPTVNKKFDFWRRIDLVVSDPIILDEKTLADHRRTRAFLMKACVEQRRQLGLEPAAWPEPADDNGEETEEAD